MNSPSCNCATVASGLEVTRQWVRFVAIEPRMKAYRRPADAPRSPVLVVEDRQRATGDACCGRPLRIQTCWHRPPPALSAIGKQQRRCRCIACNRSARCGSHRRAQRQSAARSARSAHARVATSVAVARALAVWLRTHDHAHARFRRIAQPDRRSRYAGRHSIVIDQNDVAELAYWHPVCARCSG